MRLLNVECSPRGSKSASVAVAHAFLAAYQEAAPDVDVDTLNVWGEGLPDFDSEAIGAKYKGVSQEPMDDTEAAVWRSIKSLVERFQRANRIVLGVPMWNFAYPYKLKQLIDLVSQRNMLFTFDGTRYGPLLDTSRALVIYARGQSYAEDAVLKPAEYDHQTAYIEFRLRFIGVQDVKTMVVDHTWDDQASASLEQAKQTAAKIARDF